MAIVAFATFHAATLVRSCVLLSLKVPIALSCRLVPKTKDELVGEIAIAVRIGFVTTRFVEATTDPEAAVTVVPPVASPVAKPPPLTVATPGADDVQLTRPVTFCVLPSVKVAKALNCCVVPSGIAALAGVMVRATRAGALTVRAAEPLIGPDVALMLTLPCELLLTKPPGATLATAAEEETHVADAVMS